MAGADDAGQLSDLGWRLTGSADLYSDDGRSAYNSINFITCHDGFTLQDLVSFNEKHNEANGEGNRDGENNNNAWNCGVEGESDGRQVRLGRPDWVAKMHGRPVPGVGFVTSLVSRLSAVKEKELQKEVISRASKDSGAPFDPSA